MKRAKCFQMTDALPDTIDAYSVASFPVVAAFANTILSNATAFTWLDGSEQFVVTNWHVVSGRHPDTGKHLSCHAGEPDTLRVYLTETSDLARKRPVDIRLRDEDGRPFWWVHPTFERVDIAVIPFVASPEVELRAINAMPSQPTKCSIGEDVFVIGFPLGLQDGFPIWKRASVASEPAIRGHDRPFLVDTATRSGMSGSPVVHRASTWRHANTNVLQLGGTGTRFIGIYSGRVAAKDQLEAQLGLVWPHSLIDEIVAARRVDDGKYCT